jgi:hypothetical protein
VSAGYDAWLANWQKAGWKGDWQCVADGHSGLIVGRCADCGKLKWGGKDGA